MGYLYRRSDSTTGFLPFPADQVMMGASTESPEATRKAVAVALKLKHCGDEYREGQHYADSDVRAHVFSPRIDLFQMSHEPAPRQLVEPDE